MVRALLSLALVASASAFGGVMPAPTSSKLALSRVARTADVQMQEKSVIVGAAAVGGLAGVYLTGEIQTGLIFAAVLAYSTTTASKFGNFAKGTGENAAKVWDKTSELNEQYDLLPKAKTLTDTVVTAGSNLDKNYGITAKIDEQLKLSQAIDKAGAKVDELKGSVTSKVDELKSKASD